MWRRRSLVLLALLGLGVPSAAIATSHDPTAGPTIVVEDFAFTPADVAAVVGQAVTWTIGADPEQHTVTPADGAPFDDSGQLFTGETFVVRFSQPGMFAYLCTLHPFMIGTVTVLAASTSAPSAPAVPSASAGESAPASAPASSSGPPASPAGPTPTDGAAAIPVGGVLVAGVVVAALVVGLALWQRRRRA